MSFYKKTIFLITTAIVVSSCNLKPIYQSNLKDRPLENKVSIKNIDTDIGFYLAKNLRFALNDFGSKKRLNLTTEIEISENKYSFSSSNKETRIDLIGLIHCKIIDNDHEYKFTVKEMVSYDVSDSIVANKASKKNAKKRLANLLSQAVLTDLYHANFDWMK
jgi:hypothetical protein